MTGKLVLCVDILFKKRERKFVPQHLEFIAITKSMVDCSGTLLKSCHSDKDSDIYN